MIKQFIRNRKSKKRQQQIESAANLFYISGRSPLDDKEAHWQKAKASYISRLEHDARFHNLVQEIARINRKKPWVKCVTFSFFHKDVPDGGVVTMRYPITAKGMRLQSMILFEHLASNPLVTGLTAEIEIREWNVEWGYDDEANSRIVAIRKLLRKKAFEQNGES